jgi:hypothetical protein
MIYAKRRAIWARSLIITGLLLGTAGCARHAAPAAPPTQSEPDSYRGQSSFEVLADGKQKSDLPRDQDFVPPRPIVELATPAYPWRALSAKYGKASVIVRVVIGTEGLVTEINDPPNNTPAVGPYADDFRSAVEQAVQRWKFQPAAYRQFEDGKDLNGDGKPDYQRLVRSQVVPVYLDVRFDFEIVNGKGRVRSNHRSPALK